LVTVENLVQEFKEHLATFAARAATGDFRDVVLRPVLAKLTGDQFDGPGWRIE
jgi:hypothetical protein